VGKKDLLSKLTQVYDEKYQEEKPILFPSDIPRQDVEAIAREIVSTIENYNINIDKRELEKLSKEIAEGYLFELEVDKLVNKTFEEIKEKENLDENVTLDKFIEDKEGWEIFGKYLKEANKRWEKILEKEPKNLEKYGTFIMFQAAQSLRLMKEHTKFLKDPSKIEKDAINMVKSDKVFIEFLLSLIIKAKEDKDKAQIVQNAAQTEEGFMKFVISSIKEIDLRTEIEEDELYKIKQYEDALKYKLITIFKNTKYLSQETIKSIERLKQELIKDTVELDINKTLKDAIGHAIKLKIEIRNYIEFLSQEIEEKQKLLSNTNEEAEENKASKNDNTNLQETSERLKETSKEGSNRADTIYRPIEMANLYRVMHKEEKLKDLNKYITETCQ
jgi:transposase-like protein